MSDTPRTDAACDAAAKEAGSIAGIPAMYGYMVEHARQLERELAEAKKPPPCQHTHRYGRSGGGKTEMWCQQCGIKIEPTVFIRPSSWWAT